MPRKKKMVKETLVVPMPAMIPAGEFKAKCLELMDIVNERRREFVITKRGKPVAKLIPVGPAVPRKSAFGALAGTIEIIGDIMAPIYTSEELDAFDAHSAGLLDE